MQNEKHWKWVKANKGPSTGSPWWGSLVDGMIATSPLGYGGCKIKAILICKKCEQYHLQQHVILKHHASQQ